jgi:DNA-binding response OmpR family regulator
MQATALSNRIGADDVKDEDRDKPARLPLTGNLLLVDPDDFLAEMIEHGLRLARPKWRVIVMRNPNEALALLERHSELDAILTEIVFDDSPEEGKSFITEVGRRWPDVPIFVMTARDPDEMGGLDTAEYIAKPPDMDFLVSRIDRAIRRQRESHVRGISLPTFLQILELERKSCTVFVSHAGRVGELYFREGRLIQARSGEREREEALFELLSMREHSLRVVDRCDAEAAIATPLASLLMEWSVREDHAQKNAASPDEEKE